MGDVIVFRGGLGDAHEEYERAVAGRRRENDGYIDEFAAWLEQSRLAPATIRRHVNNVEFYLNTYLLREDALPMEEGCRRLGDFLGYFFIVKCMWSTPATTRSNVASLKKFYRCMLELGHIGQESYDELLDSIRDGKDEWVEACERYNAGESFEDVLLF